MDQAGFLCLNCQQFMRVDPTISRKSEERDGRSSRESFGTKGIELEGQPQNLLRIICDADAPLDAPICKECSSALLHGLNDQLKSLEEECLSYKKLINDVNSSFKGNDIAHQKSELKNLEDEAEELQRELDKLMLEEAKLDESIRLKKVSLQSRSAEENGLWRQFRQGLKDLLDQAEEYAIVDAQLRYAREQHKKLSSLNSLDLCFFIFVDVEDGGSIGEISGFRLGRLPDKPVEWLEINAALGQCVLLLDVLFQRMRLTLPNYELVTMGSHSCIREKKITGEKVEHALCGSGSWKPFGNNNVDPGIMKFLHCLMELQRALRDQHSTFQPRFPMRNERLYCDGVDYTPKMLLNTEERWTKAMKMLLANLKYTSDHVNALRPSSS